MKTRINENSIEYQVNLNWLSVEIRRLKNKLKLVKLSQQKMIIRQVIASSEALYYWAKRLEKNNIVFGWGARVLEAAARAMDNPSDENIWLLKFAVSSPCPQTARPDKISTRPTKQSASSPTLKKTFMVTARSLAKK